MRASQRAWHSCAARRTLEFTLAMFVCMCATTPLASTTLALSPALQNTHNVVDADDTDTLTTEPNEQGEDTNVGDQETVVLSSDDRASSVLSTRTSEQSSSHCDARRLDTGMTRESSTSPSSIDWPIMVRADNPDNDGGIAPPGSEFGASERKFTFEFSSRKDAIGCQPASFTVAVEQEWATKGLSCVVWHASEILARHIHALGVNKSNMLVRIDVALYTCRRCENFSVVRC